MKKNNKTPESPSAAIAKEELSAPPAIETRAELSRFLDIPHKRLTYVLYRLDRMSSYTAFEIAKPSGGTRTLHAVTGRLKTLQRQALERLQEHWKPSAYAHGFAEGRSIITNASIHRRKKRIIKVDIADFFPSIHFGRVSGMFQAPPFRFGKEAAIVLAQIACLDDGIGALPQGGVLSPYIANMVCRRLDKRLAELAKEYRCRFTRYADDITFSTNDVAKLDQGGLIKRIYDVIEAEHFTPNKGKTKVLTPKDRQIVTGVVVNDGVNVNRRYLRSIRATLRNCELYGVPSQVVKPGAFKDARASRVRVTKPGEVFMLGKKQLSTEEACRHFLWHLLGRISFMGQVVQANGQVAEPERYRRVFAYERLLMRFFKLVERGSEYRGIRKAVLKRIADHPNLQEQLNQAAKREQIRHKVRDEHRKDPKTKAAIDRVNAADDIKALQALTDEFARADNRFFRMSLAEGLGKAKSQVVKTLGYPAVDSEKVLRVLQSLRDSVDGLGALTHEQKDFCGEKAFSLLVKYYDPVVYFTPQGLRKPFDEYIDGIKAIVQEKGPAHVFNVITDPAIAEQTAALKTETRFGGNPHDASSLRTTVLSAIAYARKQVQRNTVEIPEPTIGKTGFYTHVQSIDIVLKRLLHSMLKNTEGDRVEIATYFESHAFEICVFDNSTTIIEGSPSREFVNGKLADAIRRSDGLCQYLFEAEFWKGGRTCLDMHSDEIVGQECRKKQGFAHRLIFSLDISQ